jgi:uncharacterized protein involved in exopolysaccharide biosynthesis
METEVLFEKETLPYPFGSPRDFLTALFRQKKTIFLTFIVLFIGAAAWINSQKTLYDAHATLVLKFGREQIFRPEVGQKNQIVRHDQAGAVESERKIIHSRDLVRRVVADMGVENLYPELINPSKRNPQREIEHATSKFLGNLESLTVKGGDNLIQIIFLHEQPKVAAQGLNNLVEFLKERHLQIFSDPKASFLTKQLQVYKEQLEHSEENLQAFKRKHDLSSPLVEQQTRLLDQRADLDSQYKTIKNQLQGLQGKIASLDNQMNTILKNIPVSSVEEGGNLEKAKADLFALKRREQELLTRYTATSFPVLNLRKEIDLVEKFVLAQQKSERANTIASGKKAMYSKLELDQLGAVSESTTLQASGHVIALQIEDLNKKIQRLDELNEEIIVLERQRAADEQNYQLYLKKVEEAKVSEEMDRLKMSNISVIQAADVPPGPAGRPKHITLLLGAIFGAIMSVGLALLLEFFAAGYTRPDQAAEDLGLPVLASFSQKG